MPALTANSSATFRHILPISYYKGPICLAIRTPESCIILDRTEQDVTGHAGKWPSIWDLYNTRKLLLRVRLETPFPVC